MEQKPHAVLIPFPAQGHITPFLNLATLLHARGFHVTFVNNHHNHNRILRTRGSSALTGLPDFQFQSIPDTMPPSNPDATQNLKELIVAVHKNCLAPLRELVLKISLKEDVHVPAVSCIVTDGSMTVGMEVGKEIGVPVAVFWTASVCGLMGYLTYPELVRRGIIPLRDWSDLTNGYLDTPLDCVPGTKNVPDGVRLREIATFCRVLDLEDPTFKCMSAESQNCLKADALLFNTFDELEHMIEAMSIPRSKINTIGPLTLLAKNAPQIPLELIKSSSLWAENSECLNWLDRQKPQSVVYVNFGSIAVMTEEKFQEFLWGLANCGYPFLWVLRSDLIMGKSPVLPEGFQELCKDRALFTSWCPQQKVLEHPSISVFMTHAGWNSTLEVINVGMSVLCWAVHGDQSMNVKYIKAVWRNGLEIDPNVTREEIVEKVKELMDEEKGKEVRKRALEWKEKAHKATSEGGSSYQDFDRLVNEFLLKKNFI
ncbi:unnamed protein product [Rhodiola kirilowii]